MVAHYNLSNIMVYYYVKILNTNNIWAYLFIGHKILKLYSEAMYCRKTLLFIV